MATTIARLPVDLQTACAPFERRITLSTLLTSSAWTTSSDLPEGYLTPWRTCQPFARVNGAPAGGVSSAWLESKLVKIEADTAGFSK